MQWPGSSQLFRDRTGSTKHTMPARVERTTHPADLAAAMGSSDQFRISKCDQPLCSERINASLFGTGSKLEKTYCL